jgi:hypothetical protein
VCASIPIGKDGGMENPLDDVVDHTGAPPDVVWKGIGIGAGMLGAIVARQVIHRVRRSKGKSGQRPGIVEGVLWTALVGAGAQLGKVAAHRAVVATWRRRQARAAITA